MAVHAGSTGQGGDGGMESALWGSRRAPRGNRPSLRAGPGPGCWERCWHVGGGRPWPGALRGGGNPKAPRGERSLLASCGLAGPQGGQSLPSVGPRPGCQSLPLGLHDPSREPPRVQLEPDGPCPHCGGCVQSPGQTDCSPVGGSAGWLPRPSRRGYQPVPEGTSHLAVGGGPWLAAPTALDSKVHPGLSPAAGSPVTTALAGGAWGSSPRPLPAFLRCHPPPDHLPDANGPAQPGERRGPPGASLRVAPVATAQGTWVLSSLLWDPVSPFTAPAPLGQSTPGGIGSSIVPGVVPRQGLHVTVSPTGNVRGLLPHPLGSLLMWGVQGRCGSLPSQPLLGRHQEARPLTGAGSPWGPGPLRTALAPSQSPTCPGGCLCTQQGFLPPPDPPGRGLESMVNTPVSVFPSVDGSRASPDQARSSGCPRCPQARRKDVSTGGLNGPGLPKGLAPPVTGAARQ